MTLRLGVALCTYQGAAYVAEQLASVDAQDRPPDHVVVADDGSTDGTLDIVRAWAARKPFRTTVLTSGPPSGIARNFERAIAAVDADVVVLSDQDDVWLPHRLRRLEAALETDAGLAFSDARCVDAAGADLGYTAFQSVGLGPEPPTFDLLVRRPLVTGATLAFRAELRDVALPFPEFVRDGRWLHDRWIATVLAAVTEVAVVREPLLHYRQHGAQQLGLAAPREERPDRTLRRRRDEYALHATVAAALAGRLRARPEAAAHLPMLEARRTHWATRAALPASRLRRVGPVARELATGRYGRFSRGWSTALADLLAT